MCGRFTFTATAQHIAAEFNITADGQDLFDDRYNIAPSLTVPAVIETNVERLISRLKWGLIPHWSKDDSFASKLINVRTEMLAEKDSFRGRLPPIPQQNPAHMQKVEVEIKKHPNSVKAVVAALAAELDLADAPGNVKTVSK